MRACVRASVRARAYDYVAECMSVHTHTKCVNA